MEDMALSLGLPSSWSSTDLRRQVIRSLKRLKSRYGLINVKFLYGRDAFVTVRGIKGDSFTVMRQL